MKFVKSHKVSTLAVAVAFALAAPFAFGQGQGPGGGGGGGGGGKPPGGETAVNNLSYPAVMIDVTPALYDFKPAASPVLGKDYCYGCNVPEKIGETTFQNTSCVSSNGLIYCTAANCQTLVPACKDQTIDRIYWQKTPTNKWSADATKHESSSLGARAANYVDWSDSLESQVWWDRASIRVETTPYADVTPAQTGLTMWHVYGQGTTELWGARATDAEPPDDNDYPGAFAIVHTAKARLNIAKISGPVTNCGTPGSTSPGAGSWSSATGGYAWSSSLFNLYDGLYTAELNIGGKYVYGYNWQLRNDVVPADVGKRGSWRLTFYTATPGSQPVISFTENTAVNPLGVDPLTLPAKTFTPVVDAANQLTYIDICMRGTKGGSGSKGGGGKPSR